MNRSERLLQCLIDIFRDSSLTVDSSFELALQVLAWAKLSVEENLPLELRLSKASKPNSSKELLCALDKLSKCSELGENKAAFENIAPMLSVVSQNAIAEVIDFAIDAAENELLSHFDIPEELYILALPKGALFIPNEVIQVMVSLAGGLKEKTVYCPYDTLCLIASHVSKQGGKVSVETPWHSPIPWLTSILTSSKIYTVISDPLQQPTFLEGGKLQQFDASIAFPPLGAKFSQQTIKRNLFNRFQEETSSGSVLALRHIIAQTKEKAVIAIPDRILFSRGAEHSLREDLLRRGMIEAVINMPSALLPFTPIPFSILVLNVQGGCSAVRFFDGAVEQFSTRDGRNRTKLVNWESLIENFHNSCDEGITANISIADIFKKDANLEVTRYLLPPEQKVIKNLFSVSKTCKLCELVEFLRPSKPLSQSPLEGVVALEATITDFPDYGYLKAPKRKIMLSAEILNSKEKESFLRPSDVVIAVKGNAGRIAIVSPDAPPVGSNAWVINQSCLIMRSKGKIDPRILFIYLRSNVGETLLRNLISGATVPLIQLKQLKDLDIIVPSLEEAEGIIETFEEQVKIQSKIENLRKDLERLSKVHWKISLPANDSIGQN